MATTTEMRPFHVSKSAEPTAAAAPQQTVARYCRKTENIMKKVEIFFSKTEHMGKLLPFLHGTSKISLRMVEWFVFVHSMNQTVDWFIGEEYFNVYLDYQAEMNDNKKQCFDPMGRKWRKEKRRVKNDEYTTVKVYHGINFFYTDDDYVVTSVAQLNFFRWFIGKGVLDYMLEHFDELTLAMNKYNRDQKKQKKAKSEANNDANANANKIAAPKPVAKKTEVERDDHATKKVRVQAMKKVTKKHVEVYVSFD